MQEDPSCHECITDLMECNQDALRIWRLVKNQVVTVGMGQPVDLNQMAIWEAIDRYGVEDQIGTFEKIVVLFRYLVSKAKEESDG